MMNDTIIQFRSFGVKKKKKKVQDEKKSKKRNGFISRHYIFRCIQVHWCA